MIIDNEKIEAAKTRNAARLDIRRDLPDIIRVARWEEKKKDRFQQISFYLARMNIRAAGLAGRLLYGRRLTATQSYALPSVY